jgi:coenzyme F420-dependent glucose-6-phosphate dehydrogenase
MGTSTTMTEASEEALWEGQIEVDDATFSTCWRRPWVCSAGAASRTCSWAGWPRTVACGPDPERHVAAIREYVDAGFDHVWVHQIGPDQRGFLRFYEGDVLPKLR